MGGTYQSARLPVHGPPTIRRYAKSRLLAVDFGRRRPIEGEKGKKKKKKEEEEKKYLLSPRRPRPHAVAALARGRFFSHARRRNISQCGEKDRGD
ncbi:hypothetical protein BHE74_00047893, partial [Ensete ventricosum]